MKTRNTLRRYWSLAGILSFAVIAVLAVSCGEDLDYSLPDDGKTKVTLRVCQIEQIPFDDIMTKAASNLNTVCTRLNVAVFNSEGVKVVSEAQKVEDDKFGTMVLSLSPGEYQLVVVAHSSSKSATISSAEEVTFDGNKLSDTFYYSKTLTVGEENQTLDLTLSRCVSMLRFIFTDATWPEEIKQMKFYYIGGSSALNPATGFGAKQSRQTEIRDVATAQKDASGNTIMEVYTIPHTADDLLTTLTLTALDAEGNNIEECHFSDIAIAVNTVTQLRGEFFQSPVSSSQSSLSIMVNADWNKNIELEF